MVAANGIRAVGTARFTAFLRIYRRGTAPMDISIGYIGRWKIRIGAIVIIIDRSCAPRVARSALCSRGKTLLARIRASPCLHYHHASFKGSHCNSQREIFDA